MEGAIGRRRVDDGQSIGEDLAVYEELSGDERGARKERQGKENGKKVEKPSLGRLAAHQRSEKHGQRRELTVVVVDVDNEGREKSEPRAHPYHHTGRYRVRA